MLQSPRAGQVGAVWSDPLLGARPRRRGRSSEDDLLWHWASYHGLFPGFTVDGTNERLAFLAYCGRKSRMGRGLQMRCVECGAETDPAPVCAQCGAPPIGQWPVAAEEPSDSLAAPPGQQARWVHRARGPMVIIGLGLLALIVAVVIATTMSLGHQAVKTSSGHRAKKTSSGPQTLRSLTEDELRAGDCLQVSDLGNDNTPWPGVVYAVSCTQRHTAEVFFADNVWLPSRSYPGDSAINDKWNARCLRAFTAYDGIKLRRSVFDFTGTAPDRATWAIGDRFAICVAYKPFTYGSGAQPVNYSIKGSSQ